MKKWFLPFAAIMLLAGCNNNDGNENPEEAMDDLGTEELGDDAVINEDEQHEQDGADDDNEQNEAKNYLTKDFYNEVSQGNMPGSNIKLDDPEDDVKSQMGEPQAEEDVDDVNFITYEKYAYGVKDGKVVAIAYHVPESDNTTTSEFIEAWGAPATEGAMYNNAPGTYTLTYEFVEDTVVTVKSKEKDKVIDAIIVNKKKES
ncbi:DUF4309 domain-containing protein [Chungangia koreensis]|uniref:DUF4309 domain-containing protein n=1 Tax=Chungangia koreensis TaxID=752657 RepID=A0ABV8X0Z2_9LACT